MFDSVNTQTMDLWLFYIKTISEDWKWNVPKLQNGLESHQMKMPSFWIWGIYLKLWLQDTFQPHCEYHIMCNMILWVVLWNLHNHEKLLSKTYIAKHAQILTARHYSMKCGNQIDLYNQAEWKLRKKHISLDLYPFTLGF